MEELLEQVADHLVVVVIAFTFIVGMALKSITTIITSAGREHTRREMAAYIAEGTMTPDQAERLLKVDSARRV